MPDLNDVQATAELLLEQNPDPVPRFLLQRDVLRLPADDPRLVESKSAVMRGAGVRQLAETQESNGSWGRFHSQDTKRQQRFPTTEVAVRRALALGLDKNSDILKRAAAYMERHLQGLETWTDPPEKHEGWPVNIRFVTAGTLARIDRTHPMLDEFWRLWAEIAARTFQSGRYDPAAERQAHRELNGIVTKNKYMKLWMMYPLIILSSTANQLPPDLESVVLDWIWHGDHGVYYMYGWPLDRFLGVGSNQFPGWLDTVDMLSDFAGWRSVCRDAIDWIWEQQNTSLGWDFGPCKLFYFPLSESWRKPGNREIDCTTRVLILLRKYYDE
jgi:hypothetical protein